MKSIKIQKLSMINFKGIRSFEINFGNEETFVFADNGVGKTTIFDAFNWLLFGKDSLGRSDFEIKTLDAQGSIIPKIEHEVSSTLSIDGTILLLRRILKENWVKKRGSAIAEFAGNITEYYWNDVPVQQKEYQSNISQLLDEQIFKLITSTSAFNNLDWKQRRGILSSMVTITEEEIIGQNLAFQKLMQDIQGHKSIEDYKKMKNASIKKAKEDLANIPTRIDEVTRNKPEIKDFAVLKVELGNKEAESAKIDGQIQDKSLAVDAVIEKRNAHTLKINGIKNSISTLETEITNEANKQAASDKTQYQAMVKELHDLKSNAPTETAINTLKANKTSKEERLKVVEQGIESKRTLWHNENAKSFVFNPESTCCPVCKQNLPAENLERQKNEMLKRFNDDKAQKLSEYSYQGKNLTAEKDTLLKEIAELEKSIVDKKLAIEQYAIDIEKLEAKVNANKPDEEAEAKKADMIYETMASNNADLISLKKQLSDLESVTIEDIKVDTSELKARKDALKLEIDTIKKELAAEEEIRKADERIKQLTIEESTLAQQIADVENEIMIADQYSKAKIDALETKINEKFLYVKFKMFDQQINGGETECCEATIKGVPFSDANTAAKINAGLDIINTLTEFYQVSAPVFIDNRESIVNILPTHSQVINLVVSAADKKLRVA